MAYFGRKPKKPASVPGSASGATRKDRTIQAVVGAVERAVDQARAPRPGRAVRTLRDVRSAREGR